MAMEICIAALLLGIGYLWGRTKALKQFDDEIDQIRDSFTKMEEDARDECRKNIL